MSKSSELAKILRIYPVAGETSTGKIIFSGVPDDKFYEVYEHFSLAEHNEAAFYFLSKMKTIEAKMLRLKNNLALGFPPEISGTVDSLIEEKNAAHDLFLKHKTFQNNKPKAGKK